jgi:hypothetical protein
MLKKPKKAEPDYEKIGRQIVDVYELGYISKSRFVRYSLVRGILFGFGSALGASVLVALLIWVLSWFGQIPVLGPFFDSLEQKIETNTTSPAQ